MATNKKRLGGLRNIHVAKISEDGTFDVPVHIEGAKKVEAELDYEEVKFISDNEVDYLDFIFTGGSGKMEVKALSAEEHEILFGNIVEGGGVAVSTTDIAPNLAVLFERKKLGSNHKRLYVIYNTKFSPANISAETSGNGIEEETDELEFAISQLGDLVYYFIDTDAENVDSAKVSGWYKTVQKPGEAI